MYVCTSQIPYVLIPSDKLGKLGQFPLHGKVHNLILACGGRGLLIFSPVFLFLQGTSFGLAEQKLS